MRENVIAAMLKLGAPLYDEIAFLLRTELGEPHTYSAILAALANGCRRLKDVADFAGIASVSASRYLQTLQNLRLVDRQTPLGEARPNRSKKGRYFISDPFMWFWYRFVQPNQSLLEVGQAERVYDSLIAPQMASYVGSAFEPVCMQFLQRTSDSDWTPCRRIGRHWDRDLELDIVTENVDGSHYVCECKWTARPVGVTVLEQLEAKCQKLPERLRRECRLVVFSRRGFTAALKDRARSQGARLVSLPEIFS